MTSKEFTVAHKDRLVNELIDFLKLKSVSADPAFAEDVKVTASFVEKSLIQAGMKTVEICQTAGHPI
jgi:acetylornithine deacetylase/succinyl-diaminopimelate desuccinylase-like protein